MAAVTAMLVAAGVKAAFDIYSAKKARDAATKAADAQVAAQEKALDEQGNTLGPWVNTGGQAITTLGSLMGLNPGPVNGSSLPNSSITDPNNPRARPADVPATGHAQPRPEGMPVSTLDGAGGVPRSSAWPVTPGQGREMARMSEVTAGGQQKSSFTRMRSPNGEEDDVPEEFAPDFERQGFARVG